jgi:hypothetical protein
VSLSGCCSGSPFWSSSSSESYRLERGSEPGKPGSRR